MERRDTIAGMEALVALVERGSFSAAAHSLGLTPSATSKLLSRLEKRVGTQLVERTTRRMRLTEAGQGYYQRARGVLEAMDVAEHELDGLSAVPRGRLRVSTSVPFGLRIVPLVASFRARYPEVQVDLDMTDRLIDLIEEDIDVAIRVTSNAPPPGAVARRLATIDRVLCASPSYLDARGAPRRVEQLATHDGIFFSGPSSPHTWQLVNRAGRVAAVDVNVVLSVNNVLAVLEAARAGAGIADLPRYLIADDLQARRLVEVLPGHAPPSRVAYALYQPSPWKPLKVRAFVRHLEDAFTPSARAGRGRSGR